MSSSTTGTNRGSAVRKRARGVFSGLKIRKKLIVLHTSFSLALGVLLLVALAPAMGKMVDGAEQDQAELVFQRAISKPDFDPEVDPATMWSDESVAIRVQDGTRSRIQIADLTDGSGSSVMLRSDSFGAGVLGIHPDTGQLLEVRTRSSRARTMVQLVYGLVIVTLFAGYAFVALSLELMVLPQHVYTPIQAMLRADDAVRSKDKAHELIPTHLIPADELGEIMQSRNETITRLRAHEDELAQTLNRLEAVAIDLHKKNRLLETARKNLEGADRLASLGMMSAGIAHELNTPLAVVKGLVEQLKQPGTLTESEVKLLVRVVGRIETLSEGLLDFARVRTPRLEPTQIHQVIEEAWTLIRLDRQSVLQGQQLEFQNLVDPGISIQCDQGRMIQVFVNLIRNAVHALRGLKDHEGWVRVSAITETRDDGEWIVISVLDNGPGIDPAVIDTLFDPFVSSRLDAQGTGLGLAVADGIVREHGGIVVPSNMVPHAETQSGAKFEIHMPVSPQVAENAPPDQKSSV
ncbi:MAG: hypothetical protein JJ974_08505 [Phycisphaerales bacterium]|nr:hypothetical protein [Phycisphaerales bacterium]